MTILGTNFSTWGELDNVHKFGSGVLPGKRGRQRSIVARFLFHKHLAKVLSNTYRLKGKQYGVNRLKGKQYGVNQQYPDAIEQAHKWLYPTMKLVRDVFYVDGQIYNEHMGSITQKR